jgi:uroporphyrinogen decarboxylase
MAMVSSPVTLTPRQRVQRVFAHQTPDRLPSDYHSNPGLDSRLKEHFGLSPDDEEGLLQALHIDFRGCYPPYIGPRLHPESTTPGIKVNPDDGIHRQWIEHSSGGYWDFCDYPLKDADRDTIANWPLPSVDDFDYEKIQQTIRTAGDHFMCIGGAGVGDIMNWTGMLRGVEATMMAIGEEDEATLHLADRRIDLQLAMIRRVIEQSKGRIDLLWMGEDLGSQRGPLVSLDTYRRLLRPRHERIVALGHEFNIPVMIHSCGSSSWAFEEFIDMGIAAVDTLQPEAANMEPAYLKQRFGGRLIFHGCLSTAGPVASGSVQDTIDNTRQILDIMMPGGGYLASPTHALQDNSPTENVLAMYETIQTHGRYV